MKKMSRKNFRAGPLFSSKSSSSSTPSHGPGSSSSPAGGGGGIMRRATWADKIRDKLPPLGENEYEVLWERGVLGVIFLESEKDGIPYVSKATESCISPAVSQGDILKYVNVVRSKDHSFSDFFKILATMKKPVLLRFERVSASTPSSDEDEASQLFGVQRSSSTNAVNSSSHYARQSSANADEGDPTGKLSRANSVPQKDQKPPKAMRGAFWRATSAKDSVGPANPAAQSIGPGGVSGGSSDRMGASQAQRRQPSNRDQVSPRDAAAANGSGGQSSHSPLGPHEYQVYWETGSLGLFFGEDRSTNLPVVTRSTPSANPVVRRAVAINDTLVSANDVKSADYTFEAFFGRLQQMNKPVRLVFRRRQSTDQVVIVKQGEQQQQQQRQQQQLHQQLQQRQQQMREQQQIREQEQKRELQQQQLREQQQREQQQREQQQRELQQRELRERQQREQQEREQQMREQQKREQQEREQQMREQQKREQQMREQQMREQEKREQQIREQETREQQMREQQLLEEQRRREQEEAARNRTPSVTVDTTPSPPAPLSESRMAHRNRSPSPTVKRSSTPPPRPPSPQVRLEPDNVQREHRHLERGRTPPPISPVMSDLRSSMRQSPAAAAENVPSTNYEVSPKASGSPLVQSSPRVDISPTFNASPRASPNIGSSPKVSSSPFASPMSPFITTEIGSESSNHASSPVVDVEDDVHATDSPIQMEEETAQASKESSPSFENAHGNRSRNASEELRHLQKASIPVHEEEPVLSPLSKPTHLSPTEPWDLPEQIPSPTIKAQPVILVDEDEDVDIAVPVPPSSDIHLETAAMAEDAELIDEAEVVEDAGIAEAAEVIEDAELAQEADLADEAELGVEAKMAEEAEPVLPSLPVENSSDDNTDLDDVEVGMLASDVEVGVAVEESEADVVESSTSENDDHSSSPWDLEPEPERKKTHLHVSSAASPRDEATSSAGSPSIDAAAEVSKVDFTDASDSDSSDEFSNDPDISSDIDIVDGDIMMQEAPKDKVDSASPPKPSKSSLHANLAKYKKKGKTARGVTKLPALTEEEALTVPLVAPNAVNTTVQVRGRPKPKLTMADTPDSTTYLIKWKENRSIGLQLKEVRFAKGTYPLVTDVCQEPCCELLRHICVGDVIIEINGRNTSTMGVKKTVNFLKTCTKTTLMKIRHGPAFVTQRVSATV